MSSIVRKLYIIREFSELDVVNIIDQNLQNHGLKIWRMEDRLVVGHLAEERDARLLRRWDVKNVLRDLEIPGWKIEICWKQASSQELIAIKLKNTYQVTLIA